jgi:hypothetical protein
VLCSRARARGGTRSTTGSRSAAARVRIGSRRSRSRRRTRSALQPAGHSCPPNRGRSKRRRCDRQRRRRHPAGLPTGSHRNGGSMIMVESGSVGSS